jgi:hypothetical protein
VEDSLANLVCDAVFEVFENVVNFCAVHNSSMYESCVIFSPKDDPIPPIVVGFGNEF